jgi:hypothetical protein
VSVGLPGTGIGGIFYLMSALCMPFREGYRALAGRSDSRSRGVVVRQFFMALGVLGGIWVAGWLIGFVLIRVPAVAVALNALPALGAHPSTILKTASFFLAFATLATVLGTVEIVGTVRRWAARRPSVPVPDDDPARLTRDAA